MTGFNKADFSNFSFELGSSIELPEIDEYIAKAAAALSGTNETVQNIFIARKDQLFSDQDKVHIWNTGVSLLKERQILKEEFQLPINLDDLIVVLKGKKEDGTAFFRTHEDYSDKMREKQIHQHFIDQEGIDTLDVWDARTVTVESMSDEDYQRIFRVASYALILIQQQHKILEEGKENLSENDLSKRSVTQLTGKDRHSQGLVERLPTEASKTRLPDQKKQKQSLEKQFAEESIAREKKKKNREKQRIEREKSYEIKEEHRQRRLDEGTKFEEKKREINE